MHQASYRAGLAKDEPDKPGLLALQHTKRWYGHLPIVMLTGQHSEELAVWALRARVWDYLVKPLAPRELQQFLQALLNLCSEWKANAHRSNLHPPPAPPPPAQQYSAVADAKLWHNKTLPAVRYVESHYKQPIALETVAAICRLSPSRFSQLFKAEHGVPFSVYLTRHRVARACELLLHSDVPVKEVAFNSGFNDPSYFCRVFHSQSGISPGTYRHIADAELSGKG